MLAKHIDGNVIKWAQNTLWIIYSLCLVNVQFPPIFLFPLLCDTNSEIYVFDSISFQSFYIRGRIYLGFYSPNPTVLVSFKTDEMEKKNPKNFSKLNSIEEIQRNQILVHSFSWFNVIHCICVAKNTVYYTAELMLDMVCANMYIIENNRTRCEKAK